jgi:hypothetical protein
MKALRVRVQAQGLTLAQGLCVFEKQEFDLMERRQVERRQSCLKMILRSWLL